MDILVFNPQQLSPAPAVLIALSPICVPLLPSALTRPYPAITSLFNYHSATSELLGKPGVETSNSNECGANHEPDYGDVGREGNLHKCLTQTFMIPSVQLLILFEKVFSV